MLSKNLITKTCFYDGVEITETEYNNLLSEIREKAAMVDQVYHGKITMDAVPAEWREDIQRRVNALISSESEADAQEISADEALEIILGGGNV